MSNYILDDVVALLPEDHFTKPFAIVNRIPSEFVLKQEFVSAKLYSADTRLSQPTPASRKGGDVKVISSHETNERLEEMIGNLLEEMEGLHEVVNTSVEM